MAVMKRLSLILIALLFLGTSVGFSVVVIWQMHKDSQQSKQNAELQKALQDAQSKQSQEGKLEGTKLANFTPVDNVAELQKIDIQEGNGEVVPAGATVTAHYTGAVAKDGTIFQSSHDQPGDQPIDFSLNGVIKGWTEGVPGMKVGGKRRLLIPAAQAYGASPPAGSNIPANADLVFDIEIVAVK